METSVPPFRSTTLAPGIGRDEEKIMVGISWALTEEINGVIRVARSLTVAAADQPIRVSLLPESADRVLYLRKGIPGSVRPI
jgi:hypothetical protein